MTPRGGKPKSAFQGELGANSDEACREHFPDHEATPCATFEDAFEAVRSQACALALIPVENSIAGRVGDVHHLLPNSGLKIIGERFKPIRFQLMVNRGVKLEAVETVASHVMALGQCRKAIRDLGLRAEIASDTAGAARALAEHPDPRRAAIAPALAAELYGLDIVKRDIEDEHHNTTRFFVMTADLYKALGGFATIGVNLTKLESYMEGGTFTATVFFADVEGRPEDANLTLALEELGFFSERIEILGVYPADPYRDRAR